MRTILELNDESNVLLKCSLYSNYNDFLLKKTICDYNNREFYPELLYFENDFVKEFFDFAYTCVLSYRMTKRELEYQDAYNAMESCGWFNKVKAEETNKARKAS